MIQGETKMDILVTGGTVFASRYTAEYFRDKGHNVYVLNRGNNQQSEGVTYIQGDRHALNGKLKMYHFDAVIDVTAYNQNDIKDLVEELGEIEQYIFVSSSAVYPETNVQPFTEKQECGENIHWGAYGTDKIAAEEYLISKVPQAYIIRPPYLYGKMNNLYREAFIFDCAELDRKFYLPKDGKMILQFFDIEDMCRFIEILLVRKLEQHVFNVGNPEPVTVKEWVECCYHVLGKTATFEYVNQEINQREYFPFHDYGYQLDVTEMQKLMKDVKPLEVGLKESYEWYKENKDRVKRKPLIEYIDERLV